MPLTPEAELKYWDTKLTDLRHGQLESVQKAAAAWAKLFGGLLGVFGTVAFAGGLTSIDKLAEPWDLLAKIATLGAALAAVLATVWAAQTSDSLSVSESTGLTPKKLRQRNSDAATTGVNKLRKAKNAGIVACGLVLVGSATIVWVGEADKPGTPPKVVAVVDGKAVCGKLERATDLKVDGVSLTQEVSSITVVTECPAR